MVAEMVVMLVVVVMVVVIVWSLVLVAENHIVVMLNSQTFPLKLALSR